MLVRQPQASVTAMRTTSRKPSRSRRKSELWAEYTFDYCIRLRGDTKELYVDAPDNVRIQLQDVRYRGGVGPLGDRDPG